MSNVRYSEAFKIDAVRKCKLHNDVYWVADMLGVQPSSLRSWIKSYEGKCEQGREISVGGQGSD